MAMVAPTSGSLAIELFAPATIAILSETYDAAAPQSDSVAFKRPCASALPVGSDHRIYTHITGGSPVSVAGGNRVPMGGSTDASIVACGRGAANTWRGAVAAEVTTVASQG